jgi:RNA polymerase sigma-70 factor (ECF subfamily)
MCFDDQTLIQQIADGNQEAFKTLYTRYYKRVYQYLWYQLNRNTNWTEEVMQEVFLGIWQSARNYRRDAQVATWIFHIARNQAANARRNRLRRAEGHLAERDSSADALEEQEISGMEEVNFSVASHEDAVMKRLMLARAFQNIPEKYREVLYLVFYQGFPLNDVAHLLDIPVGTVKSRLSYARQLLFSRLCQEEESEGERHEK